MKRLCIFCGSSRGTRPVYLAAAQAMGRTLARRGLGLIYGGGRLGLMGAMADAAMAAGGEVIGVIPETMVANELAHHGLTDLRVVGSMHERKALMADLADGFIALPGGYGTFEEFCEVVTWSQLGLHRKPCGLLNVASFYDPMLALFDHATTEQFIKPAHRSMVLVSADPDGLLDMMAGYKPPSVVKWLSFDQT